MSMHAAFVLNGVKYQCKRVRGQRHEVEEWYTTEIISTGNYKVLTRMEFLTELRDELRKCGAEEIFRSIFSVFGIGG